MQEKLLKIQSKLIAPKGQTNSFGNYKYRSCEDILEALKPLLKETGTSLIITDDICHIGDRYYVKAVARLVDGENFIEAIAYAREPESKKGMDEAQITGATSSYARKYALNGLFCIDDTKDADTHDNSKIGKEPGGIVNSGSKVTKTAEVTLDQSILKYVDKFFGGDLDKFKLWRVDHGLADKMKEASELQKSQILLQLKKMEK